MYQQIQLFKRQGQSKRDIAADLNIDSKTVAKYYHMTEEEYTAYRCQQLFREKAFEEYEKEIKEVYAKNDYQRLNMASVYDYLEERFGELPGNEQTLRNFIGYLKESNKLTLNEDMRIYKSVPELPFGRQMQLDFGQYRCRSGLKLFIFAALLSASRYKYVVFQDLPFKTGDVIRHLLNCYDYFGGVPKELVIDQDKLMVVSENAGDIIYTRDFNYFIEEQDIRMYVCRKADPETKGKIENLVKYVKHNFLNTRNFRIVEEANASVPRWLERRANGKISQATKQIPSGVIAIERAQLRPIRNSLFRKDSILGREERTANEKACISVNACWYQLPSKYKNKTVEIYVTREKLFVFDRVRGDEIVAYEVSLIPGKLVSKRAYSREKEKTVQELKNHVVGMFKGRSWKRFTERNFKAFPRYVRDQCILSKKYFGDKDIETAVLNSALEYCLTNDTLSFADLNDTYRYFKRHQEDPSPQIQPLSLGYAHTHESFQISERNLAEYNQFVGQTEGVSS